MTRIPIKRLSQVKLVCKKSSIPSVTFVRGADEGSLIDVKQEELSHGYTEEHVSLSDAARRSIYNIWLKDNFLSVSKRGTWPASVVGRHAQLDPLSFAVEFNVRDIEVDPPGWQRRPSFQVGPVEDDDPLREHYGNGAGSYLRYALDLAMSENPGRIVGIKMRGGDLHWQNKLTVSVWTRDPGEAPGLVALGQHASMTSRGYIMFSPDAFHALDAKSFDWGKFAAYQGQTRVSVVQLHEDKSVTAVPSALPTDQTLPEVSIGDYNVHCGLNMYGGFAGFASSFTMHGKHTVNVDEIHVETDHIGCVIPGEVLVASSGEDEVSAEDKVRLLSKSVFCRRSMRKQTVAPNPEERTDTFVKVRKKGKSDGVKELRKQHIIDDEDGNSVTWAQANSKASGADASWTCYFGDSVEHEVVRLTISSNSAVNATGDGHTGQIISHEDALAYYLGGASVVNNHPTQSTRQFFSAIAGVEIEADMVTSDSAEEFSDSYIHARCNPDRSSVPSNRLAATDMIQFAAKRDGIMQLYNAAIAHGAFTNKVVKFQDRY